jgi:hypothetical protein
VLLPCLHLQAPQLLLPCLHLHLSAPAAALSASAAGAAAVVAAVGAAACAIFNIALAAHPSTAAGGT